MKETIHTDKAPAAIGPYSQAVKSGNLLITSGQIPLDPASGQVVDGDISIQTTRAMDNLVEVLAAGGATPDHVVKTTCFLNDMNDFTEFNEVYQTYFKGDAPARSCVAVDRLPKDVLVEVEAIAVL
ncbi:MAG: RidA family protein [Thermodesulfobacteriota bacterium]|nr:RidA family protein [Thermodesulfobacteriota bacterium]